MSNKLPNQLQLKTLIIVHNWVEILKSLNTNAIWNKTKVGNVHGNKLVTVSVSCLIYQYLCLSMDCIQHQHFFGLISVLHIMLYFSQMTLVADREADTMDQRLQTTINSVS